MRSAVGIGGRGCPRRPGDPSAALVPLEVMEAGVLALRSKHGKTTLEEEQRLLGLKVMRVFDEHEREIMAIRARREREYMAEIGLDPEGDYTDEEVREASNRNLFERRERYQAEQAEQDG